MLFVRFDYAEDLRFRFADLVGLQLLVEQVALRGGDIDQDLFTVTQVLVQLVDVPLVTTERELTVRMVVPDCVARRRVVANALLALAHGAVDGSVERLGQAEARRDEAQPLVVVEEAVLDAAEIIEAMQRTGYESPPKARFEVGPKDLKDLPLEQPRNAKLQFDLPPGVRVGDEDKNRTIEFHLVKQGAAE